MSVAVGDRGQASWVVEERMLASAVGSGSVAALSTPFLVALAEAAACQALEGKLEAGNTSVGTALSVQHVLPSPVGERVTAVAAVTAVEGRKVVFSFEATDGAGQKIGHGTHERVVLNSERFHAKLHKH
jgi:fluoroacetyl-CoA thioesterase